MTGPPIKVDIVAGQNTAIPELQRTGTEIARVASGATGGLSPVQKFSKALVLAEAREGTMALRAVRGGLTELAAVATGTTPALARMLEVVGGLGIGGPAMLLITGGIAAIAGGYALLTANARAAAAETKKLREEIVGLAKQTPEHRQVVRGRTTEVATQEIAAAEAKLAPLHEAFNDAVRRSHSPLVALAGTQKEHAEQVERARKAYADQVEKVRELHGVLRDLQQPGQLTPIEVVATPIFREGNRNVATGPLGPQRGNAGLAAVQAALGQPESDSGILQTSAAPNRPGRAAPLEAPERLGEKIGAGIAAVLAVAGGAKRGDVASVVTGVGGAASSLSQLHGLGALGPVGTVLTGLGGLVSLFGSGQAKFKLADIEGEALRKLKDVLQIPQNVSGVFVGASSDPRQTKYELDRLAAKTGVTTLPGVA